MPKSISPSAPDVGLTDIRVAPPSVKNEQSDVPRVGDFYADYSPLTPEEIAGVDAECADLFKRSKPVSR